MGCRYSLWRTSRGRTTSRRSVVFLFPFELDIPTVATKPSQESPSDCPSLTIHDHSSCRCPRTFNACVNPQASTIRNIHRPLGQHQHGTNVSDFRCDRIVPRHPSLVQSRPNCLREPKTICPRGHVCSGPLLGLSLASPHRLNSEASTAGHANKPAKSHTQTPSVFFPSLSRLYKSICSLLVD
jgi:hypothetical protein